MGAAPPLRVPSRGDFVRRRETINLQNYGDLQAKNRLWEEVRIKLLPTEDSDLMFKYLERTGSERVKKTYVEGIALRDVKEDAVVPRVGLNFLPGADRPQVTPLEQVNQAGGEPDQKDAMWRVNTAASLLMQFDHTSDLKVVQRYKSEEATAIMRKFKSQSNRDEGFASSKRSPKGENLAPPLFRGHVPLTIDSHLVKIINDFDGHEYDLQSTLIEVDGSSMLKLMINYGHLISRKRPEMILEKKKALLETMIEEDARRLYVRSPVLSRMSTRVHIISSKNTRYGVSHRSIFKTLSTSQGIKQIITLSAVFYNSLYTIGGNDGTQKLIRPRFLQMIVLLLSLLNDDDVADIAEFIESVFKINAQSCHLELLFLKVIPLMSIDSRVFIKSLIHAVEGFPPPNCSDYRHLWKTFVQRIIGFGYLLPCTVISLGHEAKSWIAQWPEGGFKSTAIFNDVPPIEVHPESSYNPLTVCLTNGEIYKINSINLERITCLAPGIYCVQEVRQGGRKYDLVIQGYQINTNINEAIRKKNSIIKKLNQLGALMCNNKTRKRLFNLIRKPVEISFFHECEDSGRIMRNVATLRQITLAVDYKSEGCKITVKDAMCNIMRDIREISGLLDNIKRRLDDVPQQYVEKRKLRAKLEEIQTLIKTSSSTRQEISDSDENLFDELIAHVFYPSDVDPKATTVWYDYAASYKRGDRLLEIESKHSVVTELRWLSEIIIEIKLEGHNVGFVVMPLQPVEETVRENEVHTGDIVLLTGQYMIIAQPADESGGSGQLIMLNYLRLMGVDETTTR